MALKTEENDMNKKTAGKKVGFYVRVSTDGQTVENQLRELRAVAKREKWKIVSVFRDDGISGAKGRDKRPGFNDLCKSARSIWSPPGVSTAWAEVCKTSQRSLPSCMPRTSTCISISRVSIRQRRQAAPCSA